MLSLLALKRPGPVLVHFDKFLLSSLESLLSLLGFIVEICKVVDHDGDWKSHDKDSGHRTACPYDIFCY